MSLVGGRNKEDGMKEPLVPADGEGRKGIGGVIFPADHAKVPVSAFVNPKHPGKVDTETLDPEAACVVIAAAHSGGSDPNRVIKEIIAGSICLGLLVTVALAFLGGSYSLTHLVDYGGSSRYKGWCAVPYNYGQEVDVEQLLASDNAPFFFHERFTLDAEEDDFKTEIEVPDFKGGRHGRFLHDFRRNLTAIIDVTGGRCFVMPLDSRHVMRPSSLVDVLLQMNKGQYQVDTKVVRETMRVVYPPLENRMSLGIYISGACNNRDTFWLERFTQTTTFSSQRVEDLRVKREDNGPIALPVTQQREPEHVLKFTEFAGHNVVELDIVGLDGPSN